jgi:uncharacterized protein YjbI with pentapeptide repeats
MESQEKIVQPKICNCWAKYITSLAATDFNGAVFTHAHFQQIAHAFLVTNDLSAADLTLADF